MLQTQQTTMQNEDGHTGRPGHATSSDDEANVARTGETHA
jgi:hypothetical protein